MLPLGRLHGKSRQQSKIVSFVKPFTVDMPMPPVLQPTTLHPAPGTPLASLGSDAVFPGGQVSVLNGVDAVPELVSGIPDGYDVHQELRFDVLGDVERLEGRGVGFPEFESGGETMPPLP
jgi:hypothetical protein